MNDGNKKICDDCQYNVDTICIKKHIKTKTKTNNVCSHKKIVEIEDDGEKEYSITAVSYSTIVLSAKNKNEARRKAMGEYGCFDFDDYEITEIEEVD